MSTHVMYSKELFSIQSHKNLESHRWVGRQEVFQFLYYCYHVWQSCNIIRCGLLAGHKFVSHTQGKKKTKKKDEKMQRRSSGNLEPQSQTSEELRYHCASATTATTTNTTTSTTAKNNSNFSSDHNNNFSCRPT